MQPADKPLPAPPAPDPDEPRRRREREEQDALRDELERQERRRREKHEAELQALRDDAHRRAVLQEQLRLAADRRAQLARDAAAAEEARLRAIRERKQSAHERRLHYTLELQSWRREQIRRAESQSSEKEEERRRWTEARRARIAAIAPAVLRADAPDASSGWVTLQTPDHLSWKRRYFMFDLPHSRLTLCKGRRDSTRAVDLDGRVTSFNEWYEGFEELEAIPHSFAIKFTDGRTWLMYADTEQDKDKLLVLLSQAAGIAL